MIFAGKSKKRDQCKNHQMYPVSETQYCPCNKYNAQPVGNWSDCVLPEGGRVEGQLGMKVQGDIKECGQGYRYQAMVCYDQDNRLVETLRCNSHGEWFVALLKDWFTQINNNYPCGLFSFICSPSEPPLQYHGGKYIFVCAAHSIKNSKLPLIQ